MNPSSSTILNATIDMMITAPTALDLHDDDDQQWNDYDDESSTDVLLDASYGNGNSNETILPTPNNETSFFQDQSTTSSSQHHGHYYYEDGQVIEQRWHVGFIIFAYFTAFIGSYSAIRLLEHGLWRSDRERENATFISKYPRLGTAIVLGSCTVWSMHFIGMQAVVLQHVEVCHDWVPTAISLCLSITGVYAGVALASRDIFAGEDRIDVLKVLLQNNRHVASKMNRQRASCHIHMVALFHKLHWIALGSTLAALGALSMHYVGMIAMKGEFSRQWSVGYISGSVGLGVLVCFAGFWILFRPLHWKVEKSWYRYASAAIIALAVCALHFLGMLSVTYIYDSSKYGVCGERKGIQNWQPDQLQVLCAAIFVPFVAFLVEHSISNELRVTYRQLLDIRLSGSQFMTSMKSTTSRGSVFGNRSSTMGGNSVSSRYSGGGRRSTAGSVKISGLPPSVIAMGNNSSHHNVVVDYSSDVLSASRNPSTSRLSMISEDSNRDASERQRFWDSFHKREEQESEEDQQQDRTDQELVAAETRGKVPSLAKGHQLTEDADQDARTSGATPPAGDVLEERYVATQGSLREEGEEEEGREFTASLSNSSQSFFDGTSGELLDSVPSLPVPDDDDDDDDDIEDDSVPSLEPFKTRESFIQDVVNDFMVDMSDSCNDMEAGGPAVDQSASTTSHGSSRRRHSSKGPPQKKRQDSVLSSVSMKGSVGVGDELVVPSSNLNPFKRRVSFLQDVVKNFATTNTAESYSISQPLEAGAVDITCDSDDRDNKDPENQDSVTPRGCRKDRLVPSLNSFRGRASIIQDVVKDFMLDMSESCTDHPLVEASPTVADQTNNAGTSSSENDGQQVDLSLAQFRDRRDSILREVVIEFNESSESSSSGGDRSSFDGTSRDASGSSGGAEDSALGRLRKVVTKIDHVIDHAFKDFSISKQQDATTPATTTTTTSSPPSRGKRRMARSQSAKEVSTNAGSDAQGNTPKNSFPAFRRTFTHH